jgi:hypothetical protein
LLVDVKSVSDEESWATWVSGGKRGSVADEERTGDGREVAIDDGELGASLLLSGCCADCHTLTSWDQSEDGVRRVLHRDSSFGVHGGSGKYDGKDCTADAESSRVTSVEEIERTERASEPGCWVRCGWSAVDALRFTGGVNGGDPFIGESSSTGGPRWSKGNAVEVEGY